ncbi:MAG: SCO family protein [Candidatus Hydrogenedentota bacterium]|nr:MAG: SCO family protein [Candidatus Hydrogenedentota bacterium]
MHSLMRRSIYAIFAFAWLHGAFVYGTIKNLNEVKDIGIREKLGKFLPVNFVFQDENGKSATWQKRILKNKPVLMVPVYFHCHYLCNYTARGVAQAINQTEDFLPGRDYSLFFISMDPDDTQENAKALKKSIFSQLEERIRKQIPDSGIQFLYSKNAKKFLNAVGFYYKRDNKNEFAHTAGLIFASDKGKLTRYLYGIQYKPRDFRFALLESGEGKIGSVVDKIVLYCFHYEPSKRYYGLIAWNVMKVGSVGFFIVFVLFLSYLIWHEKTKKKRV